MASSKDEADETKPRNYRENGDADPQTENYFAHGAGPFGRLCLIGIVRESFRLPWAQGRLFLSFLFALAVPICAFELAVEFANSKLLQWLLLPPPPPARAAHGRFVTFSDVALLLSSGFFHKGYPWPFVRFISMEFGLSAALRVIRGISFAPIVYAVGLACCGRPCSFADAVRAVPRLWRRVTLTLLSYSYFLLLIVAMIGNAAAASGAPSKLFHLLTMSFGCLVLGFAFQLGYAVTILEERYACPALWKGKRLQSGGRAVALAVFLLRVVAGALAMARIQAALKVQVWRDPSWSSPALLALCLARVLAAAVLSVWSVLLEALLYESCRALHGESIGESEYLRAQSRDAYRRLGAGDLEAPAEKPGLNGSP